MEEIKNNFCVEKAIYAINAFHNKATQDEYERYMSWAYCYNAFKERRDDRSKENIDYLALHLGFYLASWGMMRGSSFLLQKSYKVHTEVVEEILKEDYDDLNGITAEKMLDNNGKKIERIVDLASEIKKIYGKFKEEKVTNKKGNETKEKDLISDTLVTKVLLGTIGCTPAYDRYFKQSLKDFGYCQTFNEKSLTEIANYYKSYQEDFDKLLKTLNKNDKGIKYTQMKLMDMCMWQMAMDKQKKDN